MRLQTVHILLPYRVTSTNEPRNTDSQDHPSQNEVTFSLCQLCDVNSEVHYCTEGDLQISNKKILPLTQCQKIDVHRAVNIST